jgi:uncharacterized membrane protein YoaK (UPF0700 family)
MRNTLLLLLACTVGYIDAVGYRGLGHVFTANMTGNTVLLGMAVVQADSYTVMRSGLALVGFLLGGILSAYIVERDHSEDIWPRTVTLALGLEWVLLLTFAVSWQYVSAVWSPHVARAILIVLAALAMGVQSVAVRRLDVSGIVTTYMTGTLTNMVTRLVARRNFRRATTPQYSRGAGGHPGQPTYGTGLLLAVWGVYMGGAGAAALLLEQVWVLVCPLVLVLLVILTAAIAGWRQQRADRVP